MVYKKDIIESSQKINGDVEHDEYILMNLMTKLKIDPNDSWAFSHLYKRLCEEIDMLIDTLKPKQKYFNDTDSKFIKEVENILKSIEKISNGTLLPNDLEGYELNDV